MDNQKTLHREIRLLANQYRNHKRKVKQLEMEFQQINEQEPNALLSSRGVSDNVINNKRKLRTEELDLDLEPEKRPKVQNDDTTLNRNKRMLKFGLLGHLISAKDALDKEKDHDNVIKHMEKDKQIDLKLEKREKEQISLLQKDVQEQLWREQEAMKNVDESLRQKQATLTKLKLKSHYEHMQNFIATKTQPTIFWSPNEYNDDLEALRKETREFIAKKLEAIEALDYTQA